MQEKRGNSDNGGVNAHGNHRYNDRSGNGGNGNNNSHYNRRRRQAGDKKGHQGRQHHRYSKSEGGATPSAATDSEKALVTQQASHPTTPPGFPPRTNGHHPPHPPGFPHHAESPQPTIQPVEQLQATPYTPPVQPQNAPTPHSPRALARADNPIQHQRLRPMTVQEFNVWQHQMAARSYQQLPPYIPTHAQQVLSPRPLPEQQITMRRVASAPSEMNARAPEFRPQNRTPSPGQTTSSPERSPSPPRGVEHNGTVYYSPPSQTTAQQREIPTTEQNDSFTPFYELRPHKYLAAIQQIRRLVGPTFNEHITLQHDDGNHALVIGNLPHVAKHLLTDAKLLDGFVRFNNAGHITAVNVSALEQVQPISELPIDVVEACLQKIHQTATIHRAHNGNKIERNSGIKADGFILERRVPSHFGAISTAIHITHVNMEMLREKSLETTISMSTTGRGRLHCAR